MTNNTEKLVNDILNKHRFRVIILSIILVGVVLLILYVAYSNSKKDNTIKWFMLGGCILSTTLAVIIYQNTQSNTFETLDEIPFVVTI